MSRILIKASDRLHYQLCDITDPADSLFLFNLDQDPEVMRFITNGNITSQQKLQSWFVPRLLAFTQADKGWGIWKVTELDSDHAIGWILIRPIDFFSDDPKQYPVQYHNLEIGWRFNRQSWGKGFATEAATHFIEQLSQQLEIKMFSATALVDNFASINVMKKIGMQRVNHYTHSDEYGEFAAVLFAKTL